MLVMTNGTKLALGKNASSLDLWKTPTSWPVGLLKVREHSRDKGRVSETENTHERRGKREGGGGGGGGGGGRGGGRGRGKGGRSRGGDKEEMEDEI